jgi:outer membrane protein
MTRTQGPGHHRSGICTLLLTLFILLHTAPTRVQAETIVPGEPLTLQRAVEIGLKNQPAILAGMSTVKAGEARTNQSKSNFYPQVTASGGYSKISPPSGTATSSFSNPGYYDQYSSGLGLSQLIYDFGKTLSQVKVQSLNTGSSRFDLENTRDTVVFNIRQAYYNVLQAVRNRDVARQSVQQFQEHLEQARGFYEVGTKPKFDVTKAEVDLSNARLNLIKAENQVRLSRVTLNSAMGIADAPEYTLADSLGFKRYRLAFEDALNRAYSGRSDLQSLTTRKEAARESVNLARKGYFPTVNGNAGYNYSGTGFPLDHSWNYGISLNVPLFTGYLTKYQVAEAQEIYNTLNANEQSLRLDIHSQVEQAFLLLRQADESITTAETTVRQATENVDLATGRYNAGVGNPIEVTDALVALSNAEVAHTSALTDYKNAQAAIEKAIGVRE